LQPRRGVDGLGDCLREDRVVPACGVGLPGGVSVRPCSGVGCSRQRRRLGRAAPWATRRASPTVSERRGALRLSPSVCEEGGRHLRRPLVPEARSRYLAVTSKAMRPIPADGPRSIPCGRWRSRFPRRRSRSSCRGISAPAGCQHRRAEVRLEHRNARKPLRMAVHDVVAKYPPDEKLVESTRVGSACVRLHTSSMTAMMTRSSRRTEGFSAVVKGADHHERVARL